ncbi:chemotaxis protein CheY [Compostibacillus humi]|uniref:Chemotaxis protein CheY n=1 Tax=Compostibacillus humi TaxID=1245525 RepID=A0A8J2ZR57_9BACI|nr:response regulator [Compostibacillus humi]GGH73930.1 chemotaxis protein CheY [Compostibacillus humi]HLT55122.1 response regulator [Bacillota bacterium]
MAKILIADDAKFMRLTLASMVKKGNHEVVGEAENGEEAVRLYRELQPDIVTMDITMPVMNGIEAIREIMKINSNANIIVCSAMGQQKVVVEAIEAGAKDFIIKPFDESRVLETIDRILKKSDSSTMNS